MELINNFTLSIDTINHPYYTETIKDLDKISEDIFNALKAYDLKRLKVR